MYDFEPESVKDFLEKIDPEMVGIQLPSGLRSHCQEIKRIYDDQEVDVLFLSDSCYGACDIADAKSEVFGCDALVHYGHADMGLSSSLPVLFVEARMEVTPLEALEDALPELKNRVWGLTSTVQHIDYIGKIKDFLEASGVRALVGEPGPRAKYPGQVLGCDLGSAKSIEDEVDGFLYIGTGQFHPMGISLATKKRLISINPIVDSYEKIEPNFINFMKKRAAVLANAESCHNFGVLVSAKKGQKRMGLARDIVKKLNSHGYNSCIIGADEICFEGLSEFRVEALVNTACPRIPYSDDDRYEGPILTPFEVEVLLGERDWKDYQLDI